MTESMKSPLTDDPPLNEDDEPLTLEEMWENYDFTRLMADEWTDEDEEAFWGGPTPERP